MTSNQRQAIEIAKGLLLSGGNNPSRLSDREWDLLLLGAGLNYQYAPLLNVAGRVLENADGHAGYFADASRITSTAPVRLPHRPAAAAAVIAHGHRGPFHARP